MRVTTIILFLLFLANAEGQTRTPAPFQSGYTTIKGSIKNYNKDYDQFRTIEIQVSDWTTAFRRQYFSAADSLGNFSITFFIHNKQDVLFTFNNKWHTVFVYPNDTLEITIDAFNFPEGNEYKGRTAQTCIDYFKYRSYTSRNKTATPTEMMPWNSVLSPEEYTRRRDSGYYSSVKNLNVFIRDFETTDFFSTWIKNENYLSYINDLLMYHSGHGTYEAAIQLINKINIKDTTLRYNSKFQATVNSSSVLTSGYGFRINAFRNPLIRPTFSSNSAEIKVPDKPPVTQEQVYKKTFRNFIEATELVNDPLFRQSIIAERYLSILEQQDIDVGLDSVLNLTDDYRVKTSLLSKFNEIQFKKNNLNNLELENPGTVLLDSLRNRYKGYVLYLDLWGTWCAPCYSQMDLLKKVEDNLKNEKIKFIYLCCKCQKDKWEDVAQDSKGEHIFLTSEEYACLSNKFNIISVPHQFIIDKKGRIITGNIPSPIDDSFEKELIGYLSE